MFSYTDYYNHTTVKIYCYNQKINCTTGVVPTIYVITVWLQIQYWTHCIKTFYTNFTDQHISFFFFNKHQIQCLTVSTIIIVQWTVNNRYFHLRIFVKHWYQFRHIEHKALLSLFLFTQTYTSLFIQYLL